MRHMAASRGRGCAMNTPDLRRPRCIPVDGVRAIVPRFEADVRGVPTRERPCAAMFADDRDAGSSARVPVVAAPG